MLGEKRSTVLANTWVARSFAKPVGFLPSPVTSIRVTGVAGNLSSNKNVALST